MSARNDGGPAFPQNDLSGYGMGPADVQNQGLSIRDWFAGQALAGMMADPGSPRGVQASHYGAMAYEMADAMLAARAVKP